MSEFHTKVCTRCKVEQHLYFFTFAATKNRYDSWCKDCRASIARNREHVSRPKDDTGTVVCYICGEIKPLSEYHFNSRSHHYEKRCKACHNRRTAEISLRARYGVDTSWKEETLMVQDNKCAICNIQFNITNLKPCVDHDASNGKARAILCPVCNIMLGMHQENVETLRAAGFDRHAEYIERYKRIHEIKLVG